MAEQEEIRVKKFIDKMTNLYFTNSVFHLFHSYIDMDFDSIDDFYLATDELKEFIEGFYLNLMKITNKKYWVKKSEYKTTISETIHHFCQIFMQFLTDYLKVNPDEFEYLEELTYHEVLEILKKRN